jgi:phosphate transport system permease protein
VSATLTPPAQPAPTTAAPPDLEHSLRRPRTFISAALTVIVFVLAFSAAVPLFSVLYELIVKGGGKLAREGYHFFIELPPAAGMEGGGIGNALLGTLIIVGIASLISVPVGILAAVYLSEINPESRFSTGVRFCAKVLTGLPSVIAGLVAFAAIVIGVPYLLNKFFDTNFKPAFSAIAGGVALAILMLPTIILTAEDALKMVPKKMREAAVGMGCTRSQVVLKVVLPTALPGILTGVMLAVARAAGETAPLLFTALFSDYWVTRNLMQPTPSMAVLIYNFSGSPFPNQIEIAWAASLVLVILVLAANVTAQIYSARHHRA